MNISLLKKILRFPEFVVPDNNPVFLKGQVFYSVLKVINIFRFKKRKSHAE